MATTWKDAINFAIQRAGGTKMPGTGEWSEVDFPAITNRDASGLILFMRDAIVKLARAPIPAADWYGFALPALGWQKRGDVFNVGTQHQLARYFDGPRLWVALLNTATQLDAQGVPFKLVRDPAGTETTYNTMARDAWEHMQLESPADAAASVVTSNAKKNAGQPAATVKRPPTTKAKPGSEDRPVAPGRSEDRTVRDSGGNGAIVVIALFALAAHYLND